MSTTGKDEEVRRIRRHTAQRVNHMRKSVEELKFPFMTDIVADKMSKATGWVLRGFCKFDKMDALVAASSRWAGGKMGGKKEDARRTKRKEIFQKYFAGEGETASGALEEDLDGGAKGGAGKDLRKLPPKDREVKVTGDRETASRLSTGRVALQEWRGAQLRMEKGHKKLWWRWRKDGSMQWTKHIGLIGGGREDGKLGDQKRKQKKVWKNTKTIKWCWDGSSLSLRSCRFRRCRGHANTMSTGTIDPGASDPSSCTAITGGQLSSTMLDVEPLAPSTTSVALPTGTHCLQHGSIAAVVVEQPAAQLRSWHKKCLDTPWKQAPQRILTVRAGEVTTL